MDKFCPTLLILGAVSCSRCSGSEDQLDGVTTEDASQDGLVGSLNNDSVDSETDMDADEERFIDGVELGDEIFGPGNSRESLMLTLEKHGGMDSFNYDDLGYEILGEPFEYNNGYY